MKAPINHCIIIFGPTGVGKTQFAERLAQQLPAASLVNMDLGQLYTPLSIGTAKPAWKESPIPHYLFDIIDVPAHYTVIEYRKRLMNTLKTLWNQGQVPIVVGGSTFYAQSLFFPPSDIQKVDSRPQEGLLVDYSWDFLHTIDPQRAQAIHPHDRYRIKRALDIWKSSGNRPSLYANPSFEPCAHYSLFFLTRDKTELHTRINERVVQMIDQGWLEEVKQCIDTPWEDFLYTKKLIGYNELMDYIKDTRSGQPFSDVIMAIQQRTRAYAKRQHTFWRMLQRRLAAVSDPQIHGTYAEVNLTFLNLDLYISQLSHHYMKR